MRVDSQNLSPIETRDRSKFYVTEVHGKQVDLKRVLYRLFVEKLYIENLFYERSISDDGLFES